MPYLIQRYLKDQSGQFSVIAACMGLPIMLAGTFAIDYNYAQKGEIELQAALDSASLAAVTNQNLTDEERKVYAQDYFSKNFSKADNFVLTVEEASSKIVELTAGGTSDVTLVRALGLEALTVSGRSKAGVTQKDNICVLALAPSEKESFSVESGTYFDASTCAIQVNSTHENAALVDPYSIAIAKSFCVGGGASGNYNPYVNTECASVADPFKSVEVPQPDVCLNDKKLKFMDVGNGKSKDKTGVVVDTSEDGLVFSPGTYCDGVSIRGRDVVFLPGTYIMKDTKFEIVKGASAIANNVTFVFYGPKANLKINHGSSFTITAPKTGSLKNIAFLQDKASALGVDGSAKQPTASAELSGGSTMNITGAVYLPTMELNVNSESGLGTRAPSTSFIGYQVHFSGRAKVSIGSDASGASAFGGSVTDAASAVITSDDSARLLR